MHEDVGPPVEGSRVRWILWYKRITGVFLSEAAQEHAVQLRLRRARCVQYHCLEARKPHNPKLAPVGQPSHMAEAGQIYAALILRIYMKGV